MDKWIRMIILAMVAVILTLSYLEQTEVKKRLNYIINQNHYQASRTDSVIVILDSVFIDIYQAR